MTEQQPKSPLPKQQPVANSATPFHPRFPTTGFGPLSRLRADFDRVFENLFSMAPSWSNRGREGHDGDWGLDIEDRDDSIVVHAEAPGFEPGDFDIQVRDNELCLCGSHHAEATEAGNGHRWEERELCRTISLPNGISVDQVNAEYRNGILTVTVPKTEQSRSKKIEVKGEVR
jgi:HSP20 family protein